jgi:small subunit ribosomal protein S13
MLIIFGIKLPQNKKIRYALTSLYGIGLTTASQICDQLSFPTNITINDLTETQKLALSRLIKQNYKIESTLRKEVRKNIEKYVKNESIRGFRHRHGLPVRGQRTHTNAKTQRKLKRVFIKKK